MMATPIHYAWITIKARYIDGVISRKGDIVAKSSVSRNFWYPTHNDLYFMPGINFEIFVGVTPKW